MLLNPSNVRPVVMGTRAVMDIAWDAKPWLAKDRDYSSAWLAAWCQEEFSPKAAPLVEQYYRAYFAAPARFGEKENAAMADDFYHQLGRDLLVRIMRDDVRPPARFKNPAAQSYAEYTSRVASMCMEAEPDGTMRAPCRASRSPGAPQPAGVLPGARSYPAWRPRALQPDAQKHRRSCLARDVSIGEA